MWWTDALVRYAPRQKPFELARPDRVLQFADRFRFDLTHALARDLEDAADFFERVGVAVADAVAELDDLALAVRQGLEHLLDLVLQHLLRGGLDRVVGLLVLDEVAEVAVFRFAYRTIQRDRVAADLQHAARLADGHLRLLGDLFDGGLAAEFLHQ